MLLHSNVMLDLTSLYTSLRFQTFAASPGSAYCFSFWFHMNGVDIGQLNALIVTNVSYDSLSSEARLWALSGNNGDQWMSAQVNISTLYTGRPFRVVLEAVIGNGYRGDIAVDDTSITMGDCATQPDYAGLSGISLLLEVLPGVILQFEKLHLPHQKNYASFFSKIHFCFLHGVLELFIE